MSPQAEKAENCHDDDDCADNINDLIHGFSSYGSTASAPFPGDACRILQNRLDSQVFQHGVMRREMGEGMSLRFASPSWLSSLLVHS
jgi:hypothetical protein